MAQIDLKGRTIAKSVESKQGQSLLDHAILHELDWGFSCTRGTCARCRCFVEQGMSLLSEPNDAEINRLDEDELEQGYRLGCQAIIEREGYIKAENKTYF